MRLTILILFGVLVTNTSCTKLNTEFNNKTKIPTSYKLKEPVQEYIETRNRFKASSQNPQEIRVNFKSVNHGLNKYEPPNIHTVPRKKILVKKRGGLLLSHINDFKISTDKQYNITRGRFINSTPGINALERNKTKCYQKYIRPTNISYIDENINSFTASYKNKSNRRTRSTTLQNTQNGSNSTKNNNDKSKRRSKSKPLKNAYSNSAMNRRKVKSKRRTKSTSLINSKDDDIKKSKRRKEKKKIKNRRKSKALHQDKNKNTYKSNMAHKIILKDGTKSTLKRSVDEIRNKNESKSNTATSLFVEKSDWEKFKSNPKTKINHSIDKKTTANPILINISNKSKNYASYKSFDRNSLLSYSVVPKVHYKTMTGNALVRSPHKRMNSTIILSKSYVPSFRQLFNKPSKHIHGYDLKRNQYNFFGGNKVSIPKNQTFQDYPLKVNISLGGNTQEPNTQEFLKRKKRETIVTVIDTFPPVHYKKVCAKKPPRKIHKMVNTIYLDYKGKNIYNRLKKHSIPLSHDSNDHNLDKRHHPLRDESKDYEDWLQLDTLYRKIANPKRKKPNKIRKKNRYPGSQNSKTSPSTSYPPKEIYPTRYRDREVTDQKLVYKDSYDRNPNFPHKKHPKKYYSNMDYEKPYQDKRILENTYPKKHHQHMYDTKIYPSDFNDEEYLRNTQYEIAYEETQKPEFFYSKNHFLGTYSNDYQDATDNYPPDLISSTKNFPNVEHEMIYEDNQRPKRPNNINNLQDTYSTETVNSDHKKGHRPRGFYKISQTPSEILYQSTAAPNRYNLYKQQPESYQQAIFDDQDLNYEKIHTKVPHKYTYHPSSNNPIADYTPRLPAHMNTQNMAEPHFNSLTSAPQNYNNLRQQDSTVFESKYHQVIKTPKINLSSKSQGFGEPPKDYAHMRPPQSLQHQVSAYEEERKPEPDTSNQPLGIITKNLPFTHKIVAFDDESDKISTLLSQKIQYSTVTPKKPQAFIENETINKPFPNSVSQSSNILVRINDRAKDVKYNLNHDEVHGVPLKLNSEEKAYDAENFYEQHDIIPSKKAYGYHTTDSDKKPQMSIKIQKNNEYSESPDEDYYDEIQKISTKQESIKKKRYYATIPPIIDQFEEFLKVEGHSDVTATPEKPFQERDKSKDKRVQTTSQNRSRFIGSSESYHDQLYPDYQNMMNSEFDIEVDRELDVHKPLFGDVLNQNVGQDAAKSISKVIVGGQYAEPPARYIPKLKIRSLSHNTSTMTPYINYKNSNMAFSPQNLNDAFSVMK